MSGIGKSIVTESRFVVARGWEEGMESGFLMENVLELDGDDGYTTL